MPLSPQEMAITADGRILVVISGAASPSVSYWSVASRRRLGAPIPFEVESLHMVVDPAGKSVYTTLVPKRRANLLAALVGASPWKTQRWPIPAPTAGATAEVVEQVARETGLELNESGEIRALASAKWRSIAAP